MNSVFMSVLLCYIKLHSGHALVVAFTKKTLKINIFAHKSG